MFSRCNHHDENQSGAKFVPWTALPPQKLDNNTRESTRPHPDAFTPNHLRLENLLDATLATVMIILDNDPILTLSDHAERAFRALCRRIDLGNCSVPHPALSAAAAPAAPPPTPATYAEAVQTRDDKSIDPPTPKPAAPKPAPLRHSAVDADLIFRVDKLSPPPAVYPQPAECFTALQKTFADFPDLSLAGLRWTRNGNLSVNFDHNASWTSEKALAAAPTIWKAVEPLLSFPKPCPVPSVDLGGVWHSVLVHNIPDLPPKGDSNTLSLGAWLRMGGLQGTFAEARPMCTVDEAGNTKTLSMRISFRSKAQADHIVQHGALVFGSRCRASHCKPRTIPARSAAA
ncbi:hypothetical protein R3P38DRAFT_2722914 [Favolaschia claudopus]|uniref:Uncharacterized protein n=1 Tax=Favolaschia claudopus TaxID=2862362 RepID=A0AAW0AIC0_9AGAR